MSQEKSTMPVSRQIRYFRQSRENWKQNAAKKQHKIRKYEQTIRSLLLSRDNWKTRAQQAEKRVKELEKKLEKQEAKKSEVPVENVAKAKGHHYTIKTIKVT